MALVLCQRKPLPIAQPGYRDRQWKDNVTRRKNKVGETLEIPYGNRSDFGLGFIVTGMIQKYPSFKEPHFKSAIKLWEQRWGKATVGKDIDF